MAFTAFLTDLGSALALVTGFNRTIGVPAAFAFAKFSRATRIFSLCSSLRVLILFFRPFV